jgi:hypothetical protein
MLWLDTVLGFARAVCCGVFCSCCGLCHDGSPDDDEERLDLERTGKASCEPCRAPRYPWFIPSDVSGTENLLGQRQQDGGSSMAARLNEQYEELSSPDFKQNSYNQTEFVPAPSTGSSTEAGLPREGLEVSDGHQTSDAESHDDGDRCEQYNSTAITLM